jgi:NOL1/NOP2/fmu family ribosome biogenesis protein
LPSRPSFTFDPLFHAGCYYVQEASSMFLEQALTQLVDLKTSLKVLDISAAPGGKSTHLQSLLSADSLLVSNEVIRSRSNILVDNMVKWGAANVVVTNNDPSNFKKLTGFFDVLVVDAPCSGSGLFRKDPDAINEWSVNNVALCSQRQQRILADILPCLKEGGLLVYSTCSYSVEEDEAISDWLVSEMGLQNEGLSVDTATGIVETTSLETNSKGYRFYPNRVKGEGFFLACFKKPFGESESRLKPNKWERASAKEKAIIDQWLQSEMEVIKDRDVFYAIPGSLSADMALIQAALHVSYKGVRLGQIMKDKLVPDHALALSPLLSVAVPSTALSYEQAIKYLQRQELNAQPETQGWQTVTYQNQRLGWINALSNRINNYYPKESRILKQTNDRSFEK